jgi:hypothetical protein
LSAQGLFPFLPGQVVQKYQAAGSRDAVRAPATDVSSNVAWGIPELNGQWKIMEKSWKNHGKIMGKYENIPQKLMILMGKSSINWVGLSSHV